MMTERGREEWLRERKGGGGGGKQEARPGTAVRFRRGKKIGKCLGLLVLFFIFCSLLSDPSL